jgi:hypothetical protein
MTASSSTMRFKRDPLFGFLSGNRVSTDALNALERWRGQDTRRAYRVSLGEESRDYLVAVLSTDSTDALAGEVLDRACADFGITRAVES